MNQMTGGNPLLDMTYDQLMLSHKTCADEVRIVRQQQMQIHREVTRRDEELARQNTNADRSLAQGIEIKHGIEIK